MDRRFGDDPIYNDSLAAPDITFKRSRQRANIWRLKFHCPTLSRSREVDFPRSGSLLTRLDRTPKVHTLLYTLLNYAYDH